MVRCKLERKHYKYVIIGSLATISIILLIVFLSGSKTKASDTAEKAKNTGNKTATNTTELQPVVAVENGSESTTNRPQSQPSNVNDECKLFTGDKCKPKGGVSIKKRTELLKYVVIEKTENCSKSNANFYINCDGTVVKGLGWDVTDNGGNFLFVAFIGDFREKSPKKESINSLKELLKNGKKDKKLDSDFKVLSIQNIDDDPSRMSNKLEEEVKKLEEYRDTNVGDLFTVQIRSGRFPVVFKEEWSEERKQYGKKNTDPIKELLIQDGGKRCFSTERCVDSVRNITELSKLNSTYFKSNFFVAEDGLAYESLGWGAQNDTTLVVQFVGSYESTPPFQQAILAFRRLIKLGVWLGDISHGYEVIFGHSVGKKLKDELHKIKYTG